MYISFFSVFGTLTSVIFWQVLTEIGYFMCFKLGYHSTANGKSVSNGKGGRVNFPDYVKNTESYLKKRMSLTLFERVMRLVYSLGKSLILTIFVLIFLLNLYNHTAELEKYTFLIYNLILSLLGYLILKAYERFFIYIFRLEVAWRENNRPFFIRK